MPPKKKATKKTPKAGDAERGTPSPKPKPANEGVEMGSSEQVEAAAPPEATQKSAAPKKKSGKKPDDNYSGDEQVDEDISDEEDAEQDVMDEAEGRCPGELGRCPGELDGWGR